MNIQFFAFKVKFIKLQVYIHATGLPAKKLKPILNVTFQKL